MAVKHFTQAEVARRWRLSPRTLERWRWSGHGPAFLKLGGRVAYRLEDIEAYETAQTREAITTSHLSQAGTPVAETA